MEILKYLFVNTSCYCHRCLLENSNCESWGKQSLTSEQSHPSTDFDTYNFEMPQQLNISFTYNVDEYVAARYDNDWYIIKVLDVDDTNNELEVTFMQNKKQKFQWPSREDIIWIPFQLVICKLSGLKPTGKSHRMFILDHNDLDNETLF